MSPKKADTIKFVMAGLDPATQMTKAHGVKKVKRRRAVGRATMASYFLRATRVPGWPGQARP
jgi:hypothetical protein